MVDISLFGSGDVGGPGRELQLRVSVCSDRDLKLLILSQVSKDIE